MGDAALDRWRQEHPVARRGSEGNQTQGRTERSGPDHWSDALWLPCLDGARRVESGTFPLADGVSARVGRLRAYGNAIVPPLAAEFVRAVMEIHFEARPRG